MKYNVKIILCCLVCLMVVSVFVGCDESSNDMTDEEYDPETQEIVSLVVNEKYEDARERSKEFYVDDKEELQETLDWINWAEEVDDGSNESSQELEIQNNHNYEVRNNYVYITGRVKNVSDNEVSYFEIRADFEDETGQVLDSTYTNDGLNLRPGDMREFEIMHEHREEYDTYRLTIDKVR